LNDVKLTSNELNWSWREALSKLACFID